MFNYRDKETKVDPDYEQLSRILWDFKIPISYEAVFERNLIIKKQICHYICTIRMVTMLGIIWKIKYLCFPIQSVFYIRDTKFINSIETCLWHFHDEIH